MIEGRIDMLEAVVSEKQRNEHHIMLASYEYGSDVDIKLSQGAWGFCSPFHPPSTCHA